MLRTACLLAVLAGTAPLVASAESVRIVSDTASERLVERISGQLAETDPAETVFEARRQARQAARRAQEYLNSRGYFDAEVSHSVESGPPPRPAIKVEPGPRYRIAETRRRIIGGELSPEDEARLARAMTIEPGDFAIADNVVSQEAGLIAVMRGLGYADAEALERRVSGDREDGTISITYRLKPGPRVRFGEVIFDDGVRTRQPYLGRLIPFEEGDVFSPDKLSEFNGRLANTRLYEVSSAHLDETSSEPTAEGGEVRDVIVTLTERDRYTVTAGASVSTSEGPGVTASLTRRNATRRGDTLTARATVAAQQRTVGVDWRIPNAIAFDKALVFSADAIRDETDAFDREAVTLSGAYEVRHSKSFAYSLGVASEVTSEEDAFGQRDLQILSASAGARLDRSDDPLDPTRGWRANARAEPALATGDEDTQFFTLTGELTGYQPLWKEDRLVAAGRIRSGFVYGADIDALPVSRRFFAGGGGSARGFEFQSVGPEEDGSPTGGRGLLEISGELRWRGDGQLGYVAFVDAANVSRNQSPNLGDLRYSAGFGVRYRTVVGPIRFDIATPLDRQSGEDPIQIYVSIGQAF